MNLALKPALSGHRALIEEMMQVYLLELSEYAEDLQPIQGLFQYPYLEHYWRESDRSPFLIVKDSDVVGFLLVRQEMDPQDGQWISEVAELFVSSNARGVGVGQRVMRKLWAQMPGAWRVAVLARNEPAFRFWVQLIADIDPAYKLNRAGENHRDHVFYLQT